MDKVNKTKIQILIAITIAGLGIILDICTKLWAQTSLVLGETLEVLKIFSLHLVYNTGIAWSIPLPNIVQIILGIAILLYLGYILYISSEKYSYLLGFSIGLIWAGGLGNMYERVVDRQVTDWIALPWTPVFNIADIMVFTGVFLLALQILYSDYRNK